jgi:hypothetical protein
MLRGYLHHRDLNTNGATAGGNPLIEQRTSVEPMLRGYQNHSRYLLQHDDGNDMERTRGNLNSFTTSSGNGSSPFFAGSHQWK